MYYDFDGLFPGLSSRSGSRRSSLAAALSFLARRSSTLQVAPQRIQLELEQDAQAVYTGSSAHTCGNTSSTSPVESMIIGPNSLESTPSQTQARRASTQRSRSNILHAAQADPVRSASEARSARVQAMAPRLHGPGASSY